MARNAYYVPVEGESGIWRSQTKEGGPGNVLTDEDNLDETGWTRTGVTIVDGGTDEQLVQETTDDSVHGVSQVYAKAFNVYGYRLTFKARPVDRRYLRVSLYNAGATEVTRAVFDLAEARLVSTEVSAMELLSANAEPVADGYVQVQVVIRSDDTDEIGVALDVGLEDDTFEYEGDESAAFNILTVTLNELS